MFDLQSAADGRQCKSFLGCQGSNKLARLNAPLEFKNNEAISANQIAPDINQETGFRVSCFYFARSKYKKRCISYDPAYRGQLNFKLNQFLHFSFCSVPLCSKQGRHVHQKIVVGLHDGVTQPKQVILRTWE